LFSASLDSLTTVWQNVSRRDSRCDKKYDETGYIDLWRVVWSERGDVLESFALKSKYVARKTALSNRPIDQF